MATKALAIKYRPATWDDVTEQTSTKIILQQQLDSGEVKNAYKPNVYLCMQVEGDFEPVRAIFYNGSFGSITREYSTIEETKKPVEESIPATFTGDNKTGLTKVTYHPGQAGYDTLFTNPPVPELKPDTPSI